MYKVLLVFKDENISEKIKRMNIWGENSEFEISAVAKDGAAAYDEVENNTMIWQSCKRILTEWTDFSF